MTFSNNRSAVAKAIF